MAHDCGCRGYVRVPSLATMKQLCLNLQLAPYQAKFKGFLCCKEIVITWSCVIVPLQSMMREIWGGKIDGVMKAN